MRSLWLGLLAGCPFPERAIDVEPTATGTPTPTTALYEVPVGEELPPTGSPLLPSSLRVVPMPGLASVHRMEHGEQSLLLGLQQQPDQTSSVAASVILQGELRQVSSLQPAAAVAGPNTVFFLGRPSASSGEIPITRAASGTCETLLLPDLRTPVSRPDATSCAFVPSVDGDGRDDLAIGYRSATGDDVGGVEVQVSDGTGTLWRELGWAGYTLPGSPVDVASIQGAWHGVVGSQGDPFLDDPGVYDPAKVVLHPLARDLTAVVPERSALVFDSLDRYCPQGPSFTRHGTRLAVGFPGHDRDGTPTGGGEVLVYDAADLGSQPTTVTRETAGAVVQSTTPGFGTAVLLLERGGGSAMDLLISAPSTNQVFLFQDLGSGTLSEADATEVWTVADRPQTAGLGVALRAIGDVDGDGRQEVAVEVTNHDNTFAASTYVVFSAP